MSANERPDSAEIDAGQFNQIVEAYEALRQRVFDALEKRECPDWWLRTAFRNAGPEGIHSMHGDSKGIHVSGSCWTNQTGGSNEVWGFTLPYDALDTRDTAPTETERDRQRDRQQPWHPASRGWAG